MEKKDEKNIDELFVLFLKAITLVKAGAGVHSDEYITAEKIEKAGTIIYKELQKG